MKIFALNASLELGQRIAELLGCPLDPHEEREFSYGEHKIRPLVDVWAQDVFVISSLHGDRDLSVNDKICRLAFFTGSLKDAGARSATAVLPYFAYSRKDRRTKPSDPVSTRYLATMFESVGIDRIVTVDVHNPAALDNSFRCPAVNLNTIGLFADHFHRTIEDSLDSIVAPDFGGLKTTRLFIDAYKRVSGKTLPMAVMDKRRSEGQVSGSGLIGTVGDHVLVVDDMIDGGTTMCRAATACLEAGAKRVSVGATHGLFQEGAPRLFSHRGINGITISDTVAVGRLSLSDQNRTRISTIETAPIIAECVRAMNR